MRIALELFPTEGDRLEGRIVTGDGRDDLEFSGTLDLLRVLGELQQADRDRAHATASQSEWGHPSC